MFGVEKKNIRTFANKNDSNVSFHLLVWLVARSDCSGHQEVQDWHAEFDQINKSGATAGFLWAAWHLELLRNEEAVGATHLDKEGGGKVTVKRK